MERHDLSPPKKLDYWSQASRGFNFFFEGGALIKQGSTLFTNARLFDKTFFGQKEGGNLGITISRRVAAGNGIKFKKISLEFGLTPYAPPMG